MNKRNLTYLLLVLTLVIWSLIVQRLFFNDPKDAPLEIPTQPLIEQNEKTALQRDSLSLDYRDPFSMNKKWRPRKKNSNEGKRTTSKRNGSGTDKKGEVPVQKVKWPTISYRGLIRNTEEDQGLGIVNIDGRSHILKEREEKDGLLVLKLEPNSIELEFNNETRTFDK